MKRLVFTEKRKSAKDHWKTSKISKKRLKNKEKVFHGFGIDLHGFWIDSVLISLMEISLRWLGLYTSWEIDFASCFPSRHIEALLEIETSHRKGDMPEIRKRLRGKQAIDNQRRQPDTGTLEAAEQELLDEKGYEKSSEAECIGVNAMPIARVLMCPSPNCRGTFNAQRVCTFNANGHRRIGCPVCKRRTGANLWHCICGKPVVQCSIHRDDPVDCFVSSPRASSIDGNRIGVCHTETSNIIPPLCNRRRKLSEVAWIGAIDGAVRLYDYSRCPGIAAKHKRWRSGVGQEQRN